MRPKEILGLASAAVFTAAMGVGAFELGKNANDTTATVVAARNFDVERVLEDYVAIGGDDTCEADVLSTMVNINAVNTPASAHLTRLALDNVCGVDPAHDEMSRAADKGFDAVKSARDELERAKDSSHYDGGEMLTDTWIGLLPGAAISAVTYGLYKVIRARRRKR